MKKLKKTIRVQVGTLDFDYESAESIIQQLQKFIDQYGAGHVTTSEETEPYSDSSYIGIFVKREETDEEHDKRVIQENDDKLRLDASELVIFKRLQEKFGNKE